MTKTSAIASRKVASLTRDIVYRTRGTRHGPVTRLVSPSDVGQMIKPFVFLDYFEWQGSLGEGFGWHPHSGIATITYMLNGDVQYEDSTGKKGVLPAGGVEWMRAGSGVWHTGKVSGDSLNQGFQLWIALPPDQELVPPESTYLAPQRLPESGPVRVILGRYAGASSPIASPPTLSYLAVHLRDGEQWRFEPESGHDVLWLSVQSGKLHAGETITAKELVVFSESATPVDFHAEGDTVFVLGSAIKHPHELALGNYSVHTSDEALRQGELGIKKVAEQFFKNHS
jgi:redox-sensitive bicupin YhaK (pirin superfamily)